MGGVAAALLSVLGEPTACGVGVTGGSFCVRGWGCGKPIWFPVFLPSRLGVPTAWGVGGMDGIAGINPLALFSCIG